MDSFNTSTKMLGSQLQTEHSYILEHGKWKVYELVLTIDKLAWIWNEMNKHRSLFSDLTRGKPDILYNVLSQQDTLWLDIREGEATVGIIYWTGMAKMVDADLHVIFFDMKLSEKVPLCQEIGKWFFQTCPEFYRMTATLPSIYGATIRLAKKIGFKQEGKKRKSQMFGGKLVDEYIFGLTIEDMK